MPAEHRETSLSEFHQPLISTHPQKRRIPRDPPGLGLFQRSVNALCNTEQLHLQAAVPAVPSSWGWQQQAAAAHSLPSSSSSVQGNALVLLKSHQVK